MLYWPSFDRGGGFGVICARHYKVYTLVATQLLLGCSHLRIGNLKPPRDAQTYTKAIWLFGRAWFHGVDCFVHVRTQAFRHTRLHVLKSLHISTHEFREVVQLGFSVLYTHAHTQTHVRNKQTMYGILCLLWLWIYVIRKWSWASQNRLLPRQPTASTPSFGLV